MTQLLARGPQEMKSAIVSAGDDVTLMELGCTDPGPKERERGREGERGEIRGD